MVAQGTGADEQRLKHGQICGLNIETGPSIPAEGQNWIEWLGSKAETEVQSLKPSDYMPGIWPHQKCLKSKT